ncbi:pyridoxamine 5'-phosphate oxidase family protein [Spirochaeta isovalerica]|uniref:General stress protein 26 n=1 Tax=Spirochaeta isovalerica TaxID=150 RepID=A0A841RCU7_9SPIO|nr:pyridoxamine 5'-phosphate oxidase family protein [Spirochaeta isovalerica]MBB6481773.1 general stress protein 26 [Spirochaeta isovalerica]
MEKKEILEKIKELYKECFVFYLATVDANGNPGIRAVENLRYPVNYPELVDKFAGMENCFDLYMSTFKSSGKYRDLEKNDKASVYFHKSPEWFGVSMLCDVVILDDKESRKKFWADKFDYFWKGIDDPEYKLIKLVPIKIDGWTGEHQFHYENI